MAPNENGLLWEYAAEHRAPKRNSKLIRWGDLTQFWDMLYLPARFVVLLVQVVPF
jgi:hypothetical protein